VGGGSQQYRHGKKIIFKIINPWIDKAWWRIRF